MIAPRDLDVDHRSSCVVFALEQYLPPRGKSLPPRGKSRGRYWTLDADVWW